MLPSATASAYTYETNHYNIKDSENQYAYRGTKVDLSNWDCTFTCALPVNVVYGYTNIMSSSYSYDDMVFRTDWFGDYSDLRTIQAPITFSNTPSYTQENYYWHLDSGGWPVYLETSACKDEVCLWGADLAGAYVAVQIPWLSNSPSLYWYGS
jgi:hypothetical protein